jgi:hypothetical protein
MQCARAVVERLFTLNDGKTGGGDEKNGALTRSVRTPHQARESGAPRIIAMSQFCREADHVLHPPKSAATGKPHSQPRE